MKYLLLASGMALGLALQPAQAEEQSGAKAKSHEAETLHAPTNRVGDMVPTMTAPSNADNAASSKSADGENKSADGENKAADGENKAETVHAPTNRVGQQVPTMKSAENKDERTKSTTTTNGKTTPN